MRVFLKLKGLLQVWHRHRHSTWLLLSAVQAADSSPTGTCTLYTRWIDVEMRRRIESTSSSTKFQRRFYVDFALHTRWIDGCYRLTAEILCEFLYYVLYLPVFEMNARIDWKLLSWHVTTKLKLKPKWLEWRLPKTETEFISETEISLRCRYVVSVDKY